MQMAKKKKRFLPVAAIVLAIVLAGVGYYFYRSVFGPAVETGNGEANFYIRTGWNTEEVIAALEAKGITKDSKALRWVMQRKNYKDRLVVPGKYVIRNNMSLNTLVNHLRAGNGEVEVKLTFNNVRTLPELAGKVALNIEADSLSLIRLMLDPETPAKYGLTHQTFLSLFLPDTYFVEWDTDAQSFLDRMAAEYKAFWTDDRRAKAKALNLSQSEVTTLASIVQAEQQSYPQERPIIAGLYLNRLRKGMRLQSDPTVIYAIGDFSINRVLTKHLMVPSPYNTYLNTGLPPGPINVPQKSSIDAVLNADDNSYIYMCAKADFSGYHAFATSLADHNSNANAFRNALNERKIYK
jgi:UPF0755 protein